MYLPDAVPKVDKDSQYLDEAKKFLPKEFQNNKQLDYVSGIQKDEGGPNRKFEKWFEKEMASTQQVEALS
jgi:hypothetical protein